MVKPTKIILSILLLFALLAVSGCTGTDVNADDASSKTADDTDVKESEQDAVSEEVDAEETTTKDADTDDDAGDNEEEILELGSTNTTVSTNASLHECGTCHPPYTLDEMRNGIHAKAFKDENSAIHVDKCVECHTIQDKCTSCHDLPEIIKAQVTS